MQRQLVAWLSFGIASYWGVQEPLSAAFGGRLARAERRFVAAVYAYQRCLWHATADYDSLSSERLFASRYDLVLRMVGSVDPELASTTEAIQKAARDLQRQAEQNEFSCYDIYKELRKYLKEKSSDSVSAVCQALERDSLFFASNFKRLNQSVRDRLKFLYQKLFAARAALLSQKSS